MLIFANNISVKIKLLIHSIMGNVDFVNETLSGLRSDYEWERIYERYANDIALNEDIYKKEARKLKVKHPLVVYSSIGRVENSSKLVFDIRVSGQSVGNITIDKGGVPMFKIKKNQPQYGNKHFEFDDNWLTKCDKWDGGMLSESFKMFYSEEVKGKIPDVGIKEHRVESQMLCDFAKKGGKDDKKLRWIQPVRLGGAFFQFVTPLKASTHQPKVLAKGTNGGGIDILARVKHKNEIRFRLAIIELKDGNESREPQKDVMFQALTYATFIASLLRSKKSGRLWWKILRNSNHDADVPKHLHLDVVTLMPGPRKPDEEGCLDDIWIGELNVTFHLYTLYYTLDAQGDIASFSGTLKDDLKE